MKLEGTEKANKAIKISSDQEIVVYGVNKDTYSSDGFLALPVKVVGDEYYAVTYYPPTERTEIGIAGIEPGTRVTITLPNPTEGPPCNVQFQGRGYGNGQSFQIDLGEFDAFQLQDQCDLTGTRVESSRPISFFSGNVKTNVGQGGSRDHLVEQLPPVVAWGSDFVTVPIPLRTTGDVWIFVAASDDTEITVRTEAEESESFKLNRGQSEKKTLKSDTYYSVQASNPILLSSLTKLGFGYSFATPEAVAETAQYQNYLMLTIDRGQEDGLLLDNSPLQLPSGVSWRNIVGTTMVGTYVIVSKGTHSITHRNAGVAFGAYLYGAGDRESYAFPAGLCLQILTCERTEMELADGRDNDCDNLIDEEICNNQIDDDLDGAMDEDCSTVYVPPQTLDCGDIQTKTICMGTEERIGCDPGNQLIVLSAHFGRLGYPTETTCQVENPLNCASADADCGFYSILPIIRERCTGQRECNLPMNSYFLGNFATMGQCQSCAKYARVTYKCVEQTKASCWAVSSHLYEDSMQELYYEASSFSETAGQMGFCSVGSGSQQSSLSCARGDCRSLMRPSNSQVCHPSHVRLSSAGHQSWCAGQCDVERPFVQIDLGAHYQVSGFIMEGRRRWDQWVSKIGFQYSNDGENWQDVRDESGQMREFDGNKDARTVRYCFWGESGSVSFSARYVRAYVLDYFGYPAMHLDMLRCNQLLGCESVLPRNTIFGEVGLTGAPGQQVTVRCLSGFTLANGRREFTMTCDAGSRNWSGLQHCGNIVECPEIPQVQGALHNGRSTKFGSQVRYTCTQGRLQGSATITCEQTGRWSGQPPRCV